MKHNGERRPEDIEAEIERTRADMDATLHAIEDRLTPGQLVDQGLDYLRHSGANEFLANLNSSVKENPLPVTLVGVGLAWLMMGGRQPGDSTTATWRERSRETRERVSGAATVAGEKVGSTARAARDTLSQAAAAAREGASHLGASTQRQWERARGTYDHLLHEQPLVLGAAGLALGALLAASVPRTRREEALLGTDRSRAPGQASSHGSGSYAAPSMERGTPDTTTHSAPGHEMIGGSAGAAACPATDAPISEPLRRANPGMDV